MKNNDYSYFILALGIVFYLFSTMFNLDGIFGASGPHIPYEAYYNNEGIRIIYTLSMTLDLIVIGILFYAIWRKNEYRSFIKIAFVLLVIGQIILVWYEMYYGSTFSYGEVRDKHGFVIGGINNLGVAGSVVMVMLLYNFIFNRLKPNTFWISNMVIFWTIILLHYIVYKMVEVSWKLWTS